MGTNYALTYFDKDNLLQNHSCEANCRVKACYTDEGNLAKLLVAIFANEDINPNDELTLSYFGGILPVRPTSSSSTTTI